MKKYDVIIVGAGPAGIFCAYELVKNRDDLNILILEKGRGMDKRKCPKHTNGGKCVHCKPCSITTGWAGAGAFSDGKLSLSPEVGGTLPDYLGLEETIKLIKYTDEVYLDFGAASDIHGELLSLEMQKIRKKAIEANLKLVHCPVRHLGTEKAQELYRKLYDYLIERGVEVHFNSAVENLILEEDKIKGVKNGQGSYFADIVMVSVGRDGADWLMKECSKESISTEVGVVDIGVRLECRNEVMKDINDNFYEAKLIHYTHTFDDKVRTFCSNPGGFVSSEYYDDNLAVVNGHSFKDLKSDNTNFALLVSQKFTEPFKAPIEYGKHIARLANMLTNNQIMVQRFGDLIRGRRTTSSRLYRNNIIPTLKDAVPGDLSLVLPHRILKDIEEMILALDKVTPGLASDETLLYGVEVKFYSNITKVDNGFQSTSVENLYLGGDGAGITRGLMQASVNGVVIARGILKKV
ncbi:NAD(P)/FAD-dependent oxidoreductase [Labilibaculum euxinus]|uniref:FAD-dependent oxidoreductase n=1 Tax=Labilibaculum euxinus TaxID=2686357 RepID=A0A7M4D1Q6_9BACT|nr:NAD(P)-binding protein [Labilibaculum euxinus]MUP36585.1 FAD-dependent oxidoreductase [Labilibaculum euxinus]MVB05790.1 FAD-dependent oxidoreductase [Labilibaculum euxinus]